MEPEEQPEYVLNTVLKKDGDRQDEMKTWYVRIGRPLCTDNDENEVLG